MRAKEELLEDVSRTLGTLGEHPLVAAAAANRLLDAMGDADHEVAGTILHAVVASAIADHCRDAEEFRLFSRRMSSQFGDTAERADRQFEVYRG